MRVFKRLAISTVCGVAMTATAYAADPPETWLPEVKKQFFTDLVSGWYARADLGWRQQRIESVEAAVPVTSWSLEDAMTFGGGGGYKYNWFRADVTLDYANRARFQGDAAAVPGYYSAKIDSFALLANVYLDLGTWAGFTPYVGAGAGTANLRVHEYETPTSPPGTVQGTSRWNFAWAWTAGVSYRLTSNILIDVNYRYLKLGDAMSGLEPPLYVTSTQFRDISAREVRLGVRWVLD